MKIHDVEQGSIEWANLRLGRVTASEMGNLLTPGFELRTGEMPKTYLYSKVAEAWQGHALPSHNSWQLDQGHLREEDARRWAVFELDLNIRNVGFVVGDDARCGCSPDGLIGDDNGIEIKSPEAVNHVRYLTEGILPKDYAVQVHASMYVTGRPRWTFLSYRSRFPAFVLTVERDPAICYAITKALTKFYTAFDAAFDRLNAMTGNRKKNPWQSELEK